MRIYKTNADLYVFLRKLIIQTPGAMLRFALRFFSIFSENIIMRIYERHGLRNTNLHELCEREFTRAQRSFIMTPPGQLSKL